MPTTTTTYSFNKPVVGADEDDWGGYLNGNWDSVDDLLDGTTPITGIDINSGTLDGVTINGSVIGGTTAAAGTFTTLTASTSITGTLATAAQTNITSVGTLTGLTVDGNVGIGGAASSIQSGFDTLQIGGNLTLNVDSTGAGAGVYMGNNVYRDSGNSRWEYIYTDEATQYLQANGEHIWRYAASGTANNAISWSEAMRIDSSGNVGIGTSSPSSFNSVANNLVVGTGSGDQGISIYAGSDSDSSVFFVDGYSGTSQYRAQMRYRHDVDSFSFHTNGGFERMRIDSSGRLLIGTTTANTTGITLHEDGEIYAVRDGDNVAIFDRSTSDGSIVTFRKDGTTVGSIGSSYGDRINIGTGNTGIMFRTSSRSIDPADPSTGLITDNLISLGRSGVTFKDLYLSGNARVGGQVLAGSTGAATPDFSFAADNTLGMFRAPNTLGFSVSGSERMRLDASGNLLVGVTSSSANMAGIELAGNGQLYASTSSSSGHFFNRQSTDGDIVSFRKDGTTVGSIGTTGGYLTVTASGGSDAGAKLGNSAIFPCNTDGSDRDAGINLGLSTVRWKDLYLSGGVYLGGVGAANKLDDYEEGNHSPSVTCSTSGTITLNTVFDTLSYVKIGSLVTVTGLLIVSGVSSPTGYVRISLPFAVASSPGDRGGDSSGSIMVHGVVSANIADFVLATNESQTNADLYLGDAANYQSDSAQQIQSGTQMYISISYRTDS